MENKLILVSYYLLTGILGLCFRNKLSIESLIKMV